MNRHLIVVLVYPYFWRAGVGVEILSWILCWILSWILTRNGAAKGLVVQSRGRWIALLHIKPILYTFSGHDNFLLSP